MAGNPPHPVSCTCQGCELFRSYWRNDPKRALQHLETMYPGHFKAPSRYTDDQMFSLGLLHLSETIRLSVYGGSDPIEPADLDAIRDYLQHRLDNWKPTVRPERERYDNAVKELVLASLEATRRRRSGGEPPEGADSTQLPYPVAPRG